MLTIRRSVAIITMLFNPLNTASSLTSRLHNFFSAQLAGVSGEICVSICIAPNLLPPHDQPLLSVNNNSRLWGNVNVLARYGNDKRYLQVNVRATGNYVVATMPIVRGEKLGTGNVKLRRGWLDASPPCTMLDISQLVDAISLHNLSPNQPIQLAQFHQAWQVKAGQHIGVITNGDGFSANAEGQALNSAAVAQNARVHMISGQVVSGVADADGSILVNLQAVKDYPSLANK